MEPKPDQLEDFTIPELWEKLLANTELTLDYVDPAQLKYIRKGLSSHKTKMNVKLKNAELPTEDRRIVIDILEQNDKYAKIKLKLASPIILSVKATSADNSLN